MLWPAILCSDQPRFEDYLCWSSRFWVICRDSHICNGYRRSSATSWWLYMVVSKYLRVVWGDETLFESNMLRPAIFIVCWLANRYMHGLHFGNNMWWPPSHAILYKMISHFLELYVLISHSLSYVLWSPILVINSHFISYTCGDESF